MGWPWEPDASPMQTETADIWEEMTKGGGAGVSEYCEGSRAVREEGEERGWWQGAQVCRGEEGSKPRFSLACMLNMTCPPTSLGINVFVDASSLTG